MKLINRDLYLDKLLSVRNIPDIKIITGVRRSEKSKILDSFYDFLVSNTEIKNIIRSSHFKTFLLLKWWCMPLFYV